MRACLTPPLLDHTPPTHTSPPPTHMQTNAKVLGSEGLFRYADKYGVEVDPKLVQAVGYRPRRARALGVFVGC